MNLESYLRPAFFHRQQFLKNIRFVFFCFLNLVGLAILTIYLGEKGLNWIGNFVEIVLKNSTYRENVRKFSVLGRNLEEKGFLAPCFEEGSTFNLAEIERVNFINENLGDFLKTNKNKLVLLEQ